VTLPNLGVFYFLWVFFFQGITVSVFLLLGIKTAIHLKLHKDVCPVIGEKNILSVYMTSLYNYYTLLCHGDREASV